MSAPVTRPSNAAPAYQPLVIVLAAVCTGIVCDRTLSLTLAWYLAAALAAWLAWWLLWRVGRLQASAVSLLLALANVGAAWHHVHWSLYPADHVGLLTAETPAPAALEVVALGGSRRIPAPPPDPLRTLVTPERTRLDVEVAAIRDGDVWRPAVGTAALFVDGHLLDLRPGDRLRVFAQLAAMPGPQNPGEFDFARQARGDRRLFSVRCEFPECVTRLSSGSFWNLTRLTDWLRSRGDALLWRNLGRERSGLAAAMFLGSREELEPDAAQAFLETGTIHLLVISGLNVGILAGTLLFVMRVLLVPRPWALGIVALASLAYAATTDAQPPVVRATVMVLVTCLAVLLGRRALAFNSIAAAGLVVLALNPAELFHSGTQLSFLSVGVLAWFAECRVGRRQPDALDRLIAATRPWPERAARRVGAEMRRTALVSLLIWIVICPLVMARFHLVSPIAVILGPILAIPVTIAMAAGFGIFALGWISPATASMLGWLCDSNLLVMESCVKLSRQWPGNHAWVSGPADWWLAGFYGALVCGIIAPRLVPAPRWCLGLLAGWLAVGFAVAAAARPDANRLECTFLSVGHGEAVVVQLPGGRTLLYDAGRLGSPLAASRAVASFLWSRGITHLDAVVVSHADVDHYNALPALVDQFSVGVIYVSPVMFERPGRALGALQEAIDRSGVPVHEVWSGDRLRSGGDARIEVLHPPRRGVLGSDNANSIVLAIEFGGRKLLLTGDLESPGIEDVMAEEPYHCDVLLAPHHGSAYSDPPGTGKLPCGIRAARLPA